MPRRQLVLLTGILSVSILASVMTVVWGNEPLLGLDLQGGVSGTIPGCGGLVFDCQLRGAHTGA